MQSFVSDTVKELKPYFDGLLRTDPASGGLYMLDDELGDRASCCTTGLAACFYTLDGKLNGGDGFDIARRLAEDVRNRQLPSGGFTQPYYAKAGEPPVVDIAEIGAVANSLYHIHQATNSEAAKESLIRAADYLLTQTVPERPGVVLKRPGENFDVLNGDMYAAHTFGRAYELTGNPVYLEQVVAIFGHLADRFGKNEPGWWPYIENWDGSVVMGNSVLYQATIVAFAHTALRLLPEELLARWRQVSEQAVAKMVEAIRQPPSEETEAPWWTRDWSNGWELYMSLARSTASEQVREIGLNRFREVEADLRERGVLRFRPNIKHSEPDRAPVTTTFRKASGFAGIIACMALDEEPVLEFNNKGEPIA
ncbi:hypothetical protein PACILC2_48830 [Paenibacillus cisolokensis]|uniref:N-acyl-D-glucosamine 2-epimerase n=1 Tax=Paenibacillus cisolokensis TaxID=1658519 RepID=A0ABQ4NDJ1_9BACL|nr:hypothetical protein [Paenibacillus cisolokensis]GIQ66315.1 hypothetical protein PACILC2_48830 [Paenibacillus cisolokensis]